MKIEEPEPPSPPPLRRRVLPLECAAPMAKQLQYAEDMLRDAEARRDAGKAAGSGRTILPQGKRLPTLSTELEPPVQALVERFDIEPFSDFTAK